VPSSANFVGFPDSGFFLNINSFRNYPSYPSMLRYAFDLHNMTSDDDCMSKYGIPERWRCYFAPFMLPGISTPLYIGQSLEDWYQNTYFVSDSECIVQVGYTFFFNQSLCSSAMGAGFYNLATTMKEQLSPVIGDGKTGIFASGCLFHTMIEDSQWTTTTINGVSVGKAFGDWYNNRTSNFQLFDSGYPGTCTSTAAPTASPTTSSPTAQPTTSSPTSTPQSSMPTFAPTAAKNSTGSGSSTGVGTKTASSTGIIIFIIVFCVVGAVVLGYCCLRDKCRKGYKGDDGGMNTPLVHL
jgi:hypothetical protein